MLKIRRSCGRLVWPAPSHYLNQCWLIISAVPWHSSQGIILRWCKIPINKTRLKIAVLKWHPGLPGADELRWYASHMPIWYAEQKYVYRERGCFNKKMSSYQYRKSHCGDKTILQPSYLHNGISYTGKMTSLYWIRALEAASIFICHLTPIRILIKKIKPPHLMMRIPIPE